MLASQHGRDPGPRESRETGKKMFLLEGEMVVDLVLENRYHVIDQRRHTGVVRRRRPLRRVPCQQGLEAVEQRQGGQMVLMQRLCHA